MRQNKTKQMLSYWMELFKEAQTVDSSFDHPIWPDRSDIQPAQCRTLLGDMFILEPKNHQLTYRLAGTKLCGMFGKELKKEEFSVPFKGADKRSAQDWVERLGEDNYIVLISSFGLNEQGERINLETLLMPLSHNGIRGSRILGITCPCDDPYWLGSEPIVEQVIRSVRILRPWEEDKYLSSWPFKKPTLMPESVARQQMAPPTLYSGEKSNFINQPHARRVAHLTVLQGGRQN